MKKKVVITGALGRIGTIIREALGDQFSFTLLDNKTDFPDCVSDIIPLKNILKGKDAAIHLGWDSKENWKSTITRPKNKKMLENVYRAALETGVKRVIMASSIHADTYGDWDNTISMSPDTIPVPDSPYGATKVYMEALGRYYTRHHGLEVICIRFGGVGHDDKPRNEKDYEKIWLSRRDCANLIKCCIEAPIAPRNFSVFYGISNNTGRIHDWKNPVGWVPVDDASKVFGTQ